LRECRGEEIPVAAIGVQANDGNEEVERPA